MPQNKINILSTRPLGHDFIQRASVAGINLEVVSFIETEPIQSIEVQQEIEQALLQTATVIFTSGNAVEAVAAEMQGLLPEWEIFCLGNTTSELVGRYFGAASIAGVANNASELAEVIADSSSADEVIFFCGDQRRPELPEQLNQKGIEVDEIIVYETVPIPKKVKTTYDAVLFFSPSSVKSYFEVNSPSEKAIFFAIGNTTATEIIKHGRNKIIVSKEPSKEAVVEMAIEYFT